VSDALSIFAAARDAPHATALRHGDESYTFAELAALTRKRIDELQHARSAVPFALTGSNSLPTVLTLYALLERRVPVLLLHPRLTEPEREAEVRAAGRHDLKAAADAAAILYTSGTTGTPRGAVLTRAALIASARASAANLGWVDGDCWLLAMPIGRIGGLSILTRCLLARKAVALEPSFDAATLPARIESTRSTLISLVPTMLSQVLDAHPHWAAPARLRAILVGGAAASASLLQRAAERRLPIVITYGCTETCSQIVATPYARRYDTAACGAGRVLSGAELRVRNGHLQARGAMLMAGYLGEPPRRADDWFDTGDLGGIDAEGNVLVEARRSDLLVTGGENVYPAEVEHVLQHCPGVREAGVFGVADPVWGHTVAAALVAATDPPDDALLLGYLNERLAPHKRPRQICFVPSLPHTPAGKLDRPALERMACSLRPLRPATSTRT